uniref:Metaxin-2 n=1 Tax=Lygus hesperus TaxID=30085 RepID=A0A0A9WNF4_LYGHE
MFVGGDSIKGEDPNYSDQVSGFLKKLDQESLIVTNMGLEERIRGCAALTNCESFDHALAGFLSQEPWPDDVQLFQPYETEQILLPDNANCLAVQTFLKMCDLKYVVEYRTNAEEMSPSGRVPFIKCGACLISDFEPITSFVSNKGISLSAHLDEVQKADMRAFMSLVNTVLGNAENYLTWVDDETYSKITKPRYGSVHPFPLNHWLCFSKRRTVLKKLSALGWANKSLESVYEEVEKGCSALSDRLEKSRFFFGEQPTELDALVFGHMYTILTTPLPNNRLASTIRGYPNIVDHCKIIEKQLFDCYGTVISGKLQLVPSGVAISSRKVDPMELLVSR